MKHIISILALATLSLGCGNKYSQDGVNSFGVDPVEASVESGLTMISGMADEQTGATLALRSREKSIDIFQLILGEKAYAANCWRPYYSPCINGEKSATYSNCEIPNVDRTMSGTAKLSYSTLNCTLGNTGDYVARTYDVSIVGPRGGTVALTSNDHSDYRGVTFGGGGRLSKLASGYQLDVLGRHTNFVYKNRLIYSTSVRTLSPITLSGSLDRSGRVVTGGQLEVNHNIAGFTSVLTASNLGYSSTCCHPTSGTLSVTYSGSKSGTATVTFGSSCGSATVDHGGQVSTIQMSYCE